MLTISEIKDSINDIIIKYPIKKVSLFGSFADGSASDESDVDILVEFLSSNVSLVLLSDIKNEIETRLNREVDLIHAPVDECSLIEINKVVDIYEQ
ncbi:MAG TPA: nucleotidyltransferase domain-containing protein [Clostridia bacterium]|nr:nucleotidyltransferase domain-containing protein [Clostridia bacterium]